MNVNWYSLLGEQFAMSVKMCVSKTSQFLSVSAVRNSCRFAEGNMNGDVHCSTVCINKKATTVRMAISWELLG